MPQTLTPNAAAERAGVSLDTLRYYEREGLIGPIRRTTGGHRAYDDDDLFWIGLVTCLREAGLGISDLREFTALLRSDGDASDRVDFLRRHRAELAEDRTVELAETVAAFGAEVARGRAARVGAANHAAWRVERARSLAAQQSVEGYSALQLRHSLVRPRPDTPIPEAGHRLLTDDDLDFARSERLAVWCYTPLLHGAYVRSDRPFDPAYDHPGTTRTLRVLADISRELDATPNQIVLAWLLAQGLSPIVGASRVEHLDDALGARDVTLTEEHLQRFVEAR